MKGLFSIKSSYVVANKLLYNSGLKRLTQRGFAVFKTGKDRNSSVCRTVLIAEFDTPTLLAESADISVNFKH